MRIIVIEIAAEATAAEQRPDEWMIAPSEVCLTCRARAKPEDVRAGHEVSRLTPVEVDMATELAKKKGAKR